MKYLTYSQSPDAASAMSAEKLREAFTMKGLFQAGAVELGYWEQDRTVVGGAVPAEEAIELPVPEVIGGKSFCARREVGILNIGGAGSVTVDGEAFPMNPLDGLYIGRGSGAIRFASEDPAHPARYYLLSYPAHADYPSKRIPREAVKPLELGTPEAANQRQLYKVIQPETVETCQLVMGYTRILTGSVWNTMPPHTHVRRSEVYLYFDMAPDALVVHLMGRPTDTRHLILREGEAVLSPSWSVHAGAGTARYSFVWGMGGENQDFTDMQGFDLNTLL